MKFEWKTTSDGKKIKITWLEPGDPGCPKGISIVGTTKGGGDSIPPKPAPKN